MSTRGLGFSDTLSFDGTNFDIWVILMLNLFRVMDPNLERIVDMGFSPPKDPQRLSLEDEKNSYLNAQASNVLFDALSNIVIFQLMSFRDAHELWTKLQDKYGVSRFVGMIVLPPLPAVLPSQLLLLHLQVDFHKVMLW